MTNQRSRSLGIHRQTALLIQLLILREKYAQPRLQPFDLRRRHVVGVEPGELFFPCVAGS
jgi:hypothetical protein